MTIQRSLICGRDNREVERGTQGQWSGDTCRIRAQQSLFFKEEEVNVGTEPRTDALRCSLRLYDESDCVVALRQLEFHDRSCAHRHWLA